MEITTITSSSNFSTLASEAQIEPTIKALEADNFHFIVAENSEDAKKEVVIFSAKAEGTWL
jgi:DNA-binding PadR family transcriptional regulator